MIRSEQFKYCSYDSADKDESLVDMKSDPGEMTNLAGDPKYRDVLAAHRELLADWIKVSEDKEGLKYVRNG